MVFHHMMHVLTLQHQRIVSSNCATPIVRSRSIVSGAECWLGHTKQEKCCGYEATMKLARFGLELSYSNATPYHDFTKSVDMNYRLERKIILVLRS